MKTRKWLSVLLCLCMIFPTAGLLSAVGAQTGITELSVNPYAHAREDADSIRWFYSDSSGYCLFLPADIDTGSLTLYYTASEAVQINGTTVPSGSVTDAFAPGAGTYTLTCGGVSYSLTVLCSDNIPAVFITTKSGSMNYVNASKENKEGGTVRIYENGVLTVDKSFKQIKGRGNSTWDCVKKPYNIKFDEKTSLFGMTKAKKWTLLASYMDKSLIGNPIEWTMAQQMGLSPNSGYQHIDLYANGEYLGNYILCESVEIGKGRVNIHNLADDNEDENPDIDDLADCAQKGSGENGAVLSGNALGSRKWSDIPASPENVTGGYLLELEYAGRYANEISGFVTTGGQCVVIKEPENATEAEVNYIADYFEEAMQALQSETGRNAAGKHYSEYFDVESMAKTYIINELSKGTDPGLSSCYMYKDRDSDRILFGPIWDFDQANGNAAGNLFGCDRQNPQTWIANYMCYGSGWEGNAHYNPTLYRLANKQEDFRDVVWQVWSEYAEKDGANELLQTVRALSEDLNDSAYMNAVRWNHFGSSGILGSQKRQAVTDLTEKMLRFIGDRCLAFNTAFAPDSAMIFYENNGGRGFVIDSGLHKIGDSVSVLTGNETPRSDCVVRASADGYYLSGWNTKPDGTGTAYAPGSRITLDGRTTVLYAQYEKHCDCLCHKTGFLGFIWRIARLFYMVFGINRVCDCGKLHY